MRRLFIDEDSLVSVDVVDTVVEICARDYSGGNKTVRISEEAWEKISERVIENMVDGVTGGEEVE